MKLELQIPDGHGLALECGSPTKDGSRHWRAWVWRDGRNLLQGAEAFSPQEAVNKALAALQKSEAIPASVPDTRFVGLKLNLSLLTKET